MSMGMLRPSLLAMALGSVLALRCAAQEPEADAAPKATNMWELARTGDGTNPPVVFPGFGSATIVASAYRREPSTADAWQGKGGTQTVACGSFTVELQRVAPDWKVLRALLPAPSPADKIAVKRLVWGGVSSWMIDMTLAAEAHKGITATRQRYLVAAMEDGFLVLAFRGPPDKFEADRPAMRRVALSFLFRVSGLIAEYYNSPTLDYLACRQVDPTIDFNWGEGCPANGVGPDCFSIRWTGKLKPRYSETYTFTTASDDGVRLWVNGQLIVENWTDHPVTMNTGVADLRAGEEVDIKMEWYENRIHAVARLMWESASQAQEAVPATCLSASPPPGLFLPFDLGGGSVEPPGGWPVLSYSELPGGYTVRAPEGMTWEGQRPAQTLVFGEGPTTVQVSLRKVPVTPAQARSLLPSTHPKDQVEAQAVAWRYATATASSRRPGPSTDVAPAPWRYAAAWSVDCTLNAAGHPETKLLYQRYYLVPLRTGLLVFSFAAQDKDWRANCLEQFREVFDGVSLTPEVQNEESSESNDSAF